MRPVRLPTRVAAAGSVLAILFAASIAAAADAGSGPAKASPPAAARPAPAAASPKRTQDKAAACRERCQRRNRNRVCATKYGNYVPCPCHCP